MRTSCKLCNKPADIGSGYCEQHESQLVVLSKTFVGQDLDFVKETLSELAKPERPSDYILNDGYLRFDRFEAPYHVIDRRTNVMTDGFVSVADALDFAILQFRKTGVAQWCGDAQPELVYEIGG